MPEPPSPEAWGACRFCGVAVRPTATVCEICGAGDPVRAAALPVAPSAVKRRLRWTGWLRALIVIGVSIGLAVTLIQAVLSGPPNVTDPLTTSGVRVIPVGSSWVLNGSVTGGDYVVGNYTTIDPAGLSLEVAVYNQSDWEALGRGLSPTPAWSSPALPSARIIFVADYTDNFYFVFTNPYSASSHLTVTAYITTEYESNVGDEGFG